MKETVRGVITIIILYAFVSNALGAGTETVSINNADILGNGISFDSATSGDGRFVVFQSNANNLVTGDGNAATDIFLRDLVNDTTILISVNAAGTGSGNNFSEDPSISTDGRFIVFQSDASDLVNGDNNGRGDIFLRDVANDTTTLISMNTSGTGGGNLGSNTPSISADGRFVAFASAASDLVLGDGNAATDIFLRDVANNSTTLISVNAAGTDGGNNFSESPTISTDGHFIVFQSSANDLVAGDVNGARDVFLRDIANNTTTLVSVNAAGTEGGNNNSFASSVSAAGRFVVFDSAANDLVSGDGNGARDVFLRDIANNTTTLVSVNADGNGSGNGVSTNPSISADGRFVAFDSRAIDLIASGPTDANNSGDIFVRDMKLNVTSLVSTNINSNAGNSGSFASSISANGGVVAFESDATDLVVGDNNGVTDVFLTSVFADSGPIASATLPASRSVQVGTQATAFASIVNASASQTAVNCTIAPATVIPADFVYQQIDATGMPIGEANQGADIPAGGVQSYVIGFTPAAAFFATDVQLTYDCANTNAAINTLGLNTLLLAASATPIPDIIGLTTVTDLIAPVGTSTLFAVGSSNVGVTGNITVSLDTGSTTLPLNLFVCQTDPGTGACLPSSPPALSTTFSYAGNSTASFAVFVNPTSTINNDPANNRIFIRLINNAGLIAPRTSIGATSTAVRTQ